jgi:hypothetical protein
MVLAALLGTGLMQFAYDSEFSDASPLEDNLVDLEWMSSLVQPCLVVVWACIIVILIRKHLRNYAGKKEPPEGDSEVINSISSFFF